MGVVVDTISCLGAIGSAFVMSALDSLTSSLSSSSSSYQPESSITADNSRANANMLAEMKAEVRDESEKREQQFLDYINKSMEGLLNQLGEINMRRFGGKALAINITEIKSKNDDLKKEVVGFIGNYMDSRLVPSDHELSRIFEEPDDKKRKKKFDIFCRELLQRAEKELISKIEVTVHKQEEIIRKEIQSRLAEIDRNMKMETKAYEDILHMKKEQEDARIEEQQMQYCYQYELAEILLEQIES